jgi:hypothetical protein
MFQINEWIRRIAGPLFSIVNLLVSFFGILLIGILLYASIHMSDLTLFTRIILLTGLLIPLFMILGELLSSKAHQASEQQKIDNAQERKDKEPEKAGPAWDLARLVLERYFDRNLSQVRMIFFVAVSVMIAGFGVVLWAVTLALSHPNSVTPSYVAALSGILTEFIGLTFMIIYRSTMTQASEYMEILERINTVGMATQILDAIPSEKDDLKNSTRAEVVAILLQGNLRGERPTRKTKAKTPVTVNYG